MSKKTKKKRRKGKKQSSAVATASPFLDSDQSDIFEFINRKLHPAAASVDEEPKAKASDLQLQQKSNKELGVEQLSIEAELLEARRRVSKYTEGIERNARDSIASARLRAAQQQAVADLQAVQQRHQRLLRERSSRNSSKKNSIF